MKDSDDFKVYIRSKIGRGREVIEELEKHGGKNLNFYKGNGDSKSLYYINKEGIISFVEEDSEIGYLLLNSGWKELKLKQPKKERYYLIKVKEGNNACKKCSLYKKCDDAQEKKCELAALLKTDNNLDGKTLTIIETKPEEIPLYTLEKLVN